MPKREHEKYLRKREAGGWYENDPLDRELDAALAKYADVAPRAGLEKRVLANLRTKHEQSSAQAWWYWPAAALVVVVLIVFVISQERRAVQPGRAAYHPSTALPPHTGPAMPDVAKHEKHSPRLSVRKRGMPGSRATEVAIAAPKLDQFPSPQPLSEQEKILMSYVAEYPEHAVLVAQARAELLRRDHIEEMKASSAGAGTADLEERKNDTTER